MRILGVASASAALALGVAGQALACNIKDFTATANCAGGQGQVVVTDIDSSGKTAALTVLEKTDSGETPVGQGTVTGSASPGTQATINVDWKASTTYRVHVVVDGRVDDYINVTETTPCEKEESSTPTPPATPESPKPSDNASTPAESASPSASATESSAAPAGDNTPSNAPSAAAAGDSNLAETGANSNTGLIAGVAGALVVVGGGAVFFGMRRRGAKAGS